MNTKYVKVPVSKRLPEKEEEFLTDKGELYFSLERKQFETFKNTKNQNPSFWLEPVPDHSEEMLEMLEDLIGYEDRCRAKGNPMIGQGWYDKAKKIINKVKYNG
ncbi:hypothetical protein HZP42_19670 [Elizabethkingia anophelis]|nr:hypothetical protein [Elizabethkingia anophelis]MCT4238600.1 hypothetical protein [Elizabethkingia anophelis]